MNRCTSDVGKTEGGARQSKQLCEQRHREGREISNFLAELRAVWLCWHVLSEKEKARDE